MLDFIGTTTVKSELGDHPRDQKSVAVEDS
jgi:hypothetical protein